ncbi:MAG: site-2 protease family protein [Acidobacteriota bacterium]
MPRRTRSRLRGSGFDLFSVAGIRLSVDYSWFVVFFLVTWSVHTWWFGPRLPASGPATVWGLSLAAAVLLFVSVLLHELSHSFVARAKGIPVQGITLFIFGGVSRLAHDPARPMDEFLIAIAGPATSFAISAVCLGALVPALLAEADLLTAVLAYLCLVNFTIGLFNLVPAFPLDGGRVLRAILWNLKGSFTRATITAARVGKVLAFTLMSLGVLLVLATGNLAGLWWVVIGLFLVQAAGASAERAHIREALRGMPVHRIMSRPVMTVSPAQTLAQAVEDTFLHHQFVAYPVTDAGMVRGVLTLKDIKRYPREHWDRLRVGDCMILLQDTATSSPDDDVVDVLERMLQTGCGRMLVLDRGVLVGMLTRRDIMHFLRLRMDLSTPG